MKRQLNPVSGVFPSDHLPREHSPGRFLTQLQEDTSESTSPQQDFAQLLALYKRAGYEALERFNQDRSAAR